MEEFRLAPCTTSLNNDRVILFNESKFFKMYKSDFLRLSNIVENEFLYDYAIFLASSTVKEIEQEWALSWKK